MNKQWKVRRLGALLALGLAATAAATLPPQYPGQFTELSEMIDGDTLGPAELVRGGWMATQYFTPSPERMAFNRDRFAGARSRGQAGLSGLYLASNGKDPEHRFVRQSLEKDRAKRVWMRQVFGTEEAFFYSLESGDELQPLLSALPSTAALRAQLRLLRQSDDALVRRAGLFWGYWVADADYRKSAQAMAESDADPVNRACAARLLRPARRR